MRNFPSIIYLRDEVVDAKKLTTRDITFGFKVHQHSTNPLIQILIGAIAVADPEDTVRAYLVTERSSTQIDINDIPDECTLPEGTELSIVHRYPFVKAEGRDIVFSRIKAMEEMVEKADLAQLETEVLRFDGAFAVHNLHPDILCSPYYKEVTKYVHIPEGEVISLLDLHKDVVYDLAREQMLDHKDRSNSTVERYRGFHNGIDLKVAFHE